MLSYKQFIASDEARGVFEREILQRSAEYLRDWCARVGETRAATALSCFCGYSLPVHGGIEALVHPSPLNVRLTCGGKSIYLPLPLEMAISAAGAPQRTDQVFSGLLGRGAWLPLETRPWINRGGFEVERASDGLLIQCELLACMACAECALGEHFRRFRDVALYGSRRVDVASDAGGFAFAPVLAAGELSIPGGALELLMSGAAAGAALSGLSRACDRAPVERDVAQGLAFELHGPCFDFPAAEPGLAGAVRLRAAAQACGVDLRLRCDAERYEVCPSSVAAVSFSHTTAPAREFGAAYAAAVLGGVSHWAEGRALAEERVMLAAARAAGAPDLATLLRHAAANAVKDARLCERGSRVDGRETAERLRSLAHFAEEVEKDHREISRENVNALIDIRTSLHSEPLDTQ